MAQADKSEAPTAPAEEAEKKDAVSIPEPTNHWFWGLGRRKTSVARVRIRPGEGKFLINKCEADNYFVSEQDRKTIVAPLKATEIFGRVDVHVNVRGGGTTGQAGAVMMGVARALKTANDEFTYTLRQAGYLTRDSRMVERKKYGRRGARRRFQFSKR